MKISSPPSSPMAELLLLLSRMKIDVDEEVRAENLVGEIEDWKRFAALADRVFSLPFVMRHFERLFPDGIRGFDIKDANARVLDLATKSLKVAATQVGFQNDCVAALGVPHVYLKGPTLAARYYGDLGIRYSRDLDILIPRDSCAGIVHAALPLGYRILDNRPPYRIISSIQEIRAALRLQPVILLLSPLDVIIEVHKEIDKKQGLFDERRLIDNAVPQKFQNVVCNTVPTAEHFIYVCYHSSRHTWSRLHWLADLDAMMTHVSFDRTEVIDRASELGMRPLVEACMAFNELSRGRHVDDESGRRGQDLLAFCLENLAGDVTTELRLRDHPLEMPFDWALEPWAKRRVRIKRLIGRFAPSFQQYTDWPLPDWLQWLYVPSKPVYWLHRRYKSP